jgi:hypothetical protein
LIKFAAIVGVVQAFGGGFLGSREANNLALEANS